MEIIADEIVITMVHDGVDDGLEGVSIAECTGADAVEDCAEVCVELEAGGVVDVGVAEVVDVFGEVAEEEDVLFADFTGDFDL